MLDLDIGMQDWLSEPFEWDDTRRMDRGKVMTAAELDAGRDFGRYLDVDGDGIPYRTYPGTHPTQGQLLHARHHQGPLRALHRGRASRTSTTCSGCCASSRPRRTLVPGAGDRAQRRQPTRARRHLVRLDRRGDGRSRSPRSRRTASTSTAMRVRAFPFADAVADFVSDARPRVRRRAEPRRAAEDAAGQRVRHRSGAADLGAALRRHADHRALHHPRDRREGAAVQRDAAQADGRVAGA